MNFHNQIKNELLKWAHIPMDVKIVETSTEKKVTLVFQRYSDIEIKDFFELYLIAAEKDFFYAISLEGITKGELTKLNYADIYYFEAMNDNLFIYTKNSAYFFKKRLYEIENFHPIFIRINKSIVVNALCVESIVPLLNSKLKITLNDSQVLEVSRKYKKSFLDYLEE